MAEFLRVPADVPGGFITRLDRLDDGRVMCCLCMEYKTRDELADVDGEPGRKWDVCAPCDEREADAKSRAAAMRCPKCKNGQGKYRSNHRTIPCPRCQPKPSPGAVAIKGRWFCPSHGPAASSRSGERP